MSHDAIYHFILLKNGRLVQFQHSGRDDPQHITPTAFYDSNWDNFVLPHIDEHFQLLYHQYNQIPL